MPYQVLAVEALKMVRAAFEQAVASTQQFTLAASFASAKQAVEYCKTHAVDLILMDALFPGEQSGFDAAAAVKRISPKTKIIIVTSMPDLSFPKRAKAAGAESFWHQEVQEQPLAEIMERTMAGESVYPDSMPVAALGKAVSTDFTEREAQVLHELVCGASNEEIAKTLGITLRTVKAHITNLLHKTGYRSRLELALRARASGVAVKDF